MAEIKITQYEEKIQKMVAKHFLALEAALQTFTFFSVPGGSIRLPVHIAKRCKDMGVRAGVHDLIFLGEGGKTILIELKAYTAGNGASVRELSPKQEIFHGIVKKLGFASFVLPAKDGYEAIREIEAILSAHGILRV